MTDKPCFADLALRLDAFDHRSCETEVGVVHASVYAHNWRDEHTMHTACSRRASWPGFHTVLTDAVVTCLQCWMAILPGRSP